MYFLLSHHYHQLVSLKSQFHAVVQLGFLSTHKVGPNLSTEYVEQWHMGGALPWGGVLHGGRELVTDTKWEREGGASSSVKCERLDKISHLKRYF